MARITATGIETHAGEHVELDAIIYATGFDLEGHKHGFEITGADGVTLAERWRTRSDAYKATMTPGTPNFFWVTGPNAGVGTTSVVYLIEQSVNWIVDAIKTAGRDKLISVTPETCLSYSEDIQARLGSTVWASGCDSWYISGNGRNETLFPGNAKDFADQMARLNLDDLVLETIPGREATPRPNWTARREDKLDEVAGKVRDKHGVECRCIPLDLALPDASVTLCAQLESLGIEVEFRERLTHEAAEWAGLEFVEHEQELGTLGTAPRDGADARPFPKAQGDVVFDEVDFSYDTGGQILFDNSFRAEPGQMIEFRHDPGEVAHPVTVRIAERPRVDLVADRMLPPWVIGHLNLPVLLAGNC